MVNPWVMSLWKGRRSARGVAESSTMKGFAKTPPSGNGLIAVDDEDSRPSRRTFTEKELAHLIARGGVLEARVEKPFVWL